MSDIVIDLSQIVTREQQQLLTEKAEALAYLTETDWMITRRAETGKSVPREILDRRKAARDTLSS